MSERPIEQPASEHISRVINEDMVSIALGLDQVQQSFEHLRAAVDGYSAAISDDLRANALQSLAYIANQVEELQNFFAPTSESR